MLKYFLKKLINVDPHGIKNLLYTLSFQKLVLENIASSERKQALIIFKDYNYNYANIMKMHAIFSSSLS